MTAETMVAEETVQRLEREIRRVVSEVLGISGPWCERIIVEVPRVKSHGQLSTNAAMVLARPLKDNPMAIARKLAPVLEELEDVSSVTLAPPGFVNLILHPIAWSRLVPTIVAQGSAFGRYQDPRAKRVNVEFVSANPTGPLHIAHARGAIWGDAIANLLTDAGHEVCREYYINDSGGQIDVLASSVWHRMCLSMGEDPGPLPPDSYPGDYLQPIADKLVQRERESGRDRDQAKRLEEIGRATVKDLMEVIKKDLEALEVRHQTFVSERDIGDSGRRQESFEHLDKAGWVVRKVLPPPKGQAVEDYQPREQDVFLSTRWGDDVDRPLTRPDGSPTYFMNDIGYHFDKLQRGFCWQILVLGADHGGYIKRIQAAVKALSDGVGWVDVCVCQLVRLLDSGRPLNMSKRSGVFVGVRDVVRRIGVDALRFTILTYRPDTPMDIDLDALAAQTRDNPVFYIHYAHARTYSIERNYVDLFGRDPNPTSADHALLDSDWELGLLQILSRWSAVRRCAITELAPHRIASYLTELAGTFHAWWNAGTADSTLRVIDGDRPDLTDSRMALVLSARVVLSTGLTLLGVTPRKSL